MAEASPPQAVLSVSEISVAFGAKPLLKNATIAILEGERIGLVGRNGCGKSTFLKMAAGATSPDSGQINTRRGLLVGYLPQEFELEEELTVHEAVLRGASAVKALLAEYETAPPESDRSAELLERIEQLDGWNLDSRTKALLSNLNAPPADRIVGWPGDGAPSNDEAIDPLAFVQYAGAYNGLAMGALDVGKQHVTQRSHAQYGRTISDYLTVQDTFGAVLSDTLASRMYAYSFAKELDARTDNGSWEMYEADPSVRPRASLTNWSLPAKVLAAKAAWEATDKMLQVCGGRGYSKANEIERLFRDGKAGWIMAPSNEVTRILVGKWALHGAEAVDWWNQHVDEPALNNELSKLDADGKRDLAARLLAEIAEDDAKRVAPTN